MRIDTRFGPKQPVICDGREHIVETVDVRVYDGHVVERYFLEDMRINVDVSHLSPVDAPEPDDDPVVDADDNMRWRGWRIAGWYGVDGVLYVQGPELEGYWCKTLDAALHIIDEETT